MTSQQQLFDLNAETARSLLPAIIIIGILMILGLFGNPLVIYFYAFRLKPTASYIFISALACFDLLACLISMPLEMVDLIYFVTFKSPEACRTLRFVNYFAAIASGGLLIAIAVDRFRKICKPFERQISNKLARIVVIVVVAFSLLSSWPSAVFYDVIEVNITIRPYSVIGYDCSTSREENYLSYITVYSVYLFLLFIASIVILLVLYILVGKQLYQLRSFRFYATNKRIPSTSTRPPSNMTFASEVNSVSAGVSNLEYKAQKAHKAEVVDAWVEALPDNTLAPIEEAADSPTGRPASANSLNLAKKFSKLLSSNKVAPMPDDDSGEEQEIDDEDVSDFESEVMEMPQFQAPKPIRQTRSFTESSKSEKIQPKSLLKKAKSLRNIISRPINGPPMSRLSFIGNRLARCRSVDIDEKKMQSQNINTRKYTIIAICISVAFVVSFLPYLILMIWWTAYTDHEINFMNSSELVAYSIFIRSFLLNCVCNPFIYGFLNTEFKTMVVKGIKRTFRCCIKQKTPRVIRVKSAGPTPRLNRVGTSLA